MLDGLQYGAASRGFNIDMGTYGRVKGKATCFGCAATCAVLQAKGWKNRVSVLEACERAVDMPEHELDEQDRDLWRFEAAINDARMGFLVSLFSYMGVANANSDQWCRVFELNLNDDDWHTQIPDVEAVIKSVAEAGY